MTIDECVEKWHYKPLPTELSFKQRIFYRQNIPNFLKIDGDLNQELFVNNINFAHGYSRIVIGDYGAYIEIPYSLIIHDVIGIRQNQLYRFENKYKNSKYYWYSIFGAPLEKLYYQTHEVDYADYKIGMFYISPINIKIKKEE